MKKLFLAICFICFTAPLTQAKIQQIFDVGAIPTAQSPVQNNTPKMHNITADEFEVFLQDRITKTVIEDADKVSTKAFQAEPGNRSKTSSNNKSEFEKIYEQALQRIRKQDEQRLSRNDIQFPETITQPQEIPSLADWQKSDIPMINVTLPVDNIKITAPALEHIPYFRSNLEILPNGTLKVEEIIVVVADGNKLKNGLTKVLPKYNSSSKSSKISYTIIDVQANDLDIPYKITEGNDTFYMVPQDGYELDTGVYTYRFNYLVHNALVSANDLKSLYWNITGSSWNLVIVRAAATLILPPEVQNIGFSILSGHPNYLRQDLIRTFKIDNNQIGLISLHPIFPGNGMHMFLNIPADGLIKPDFSQQLFNLLDQYSDLVLSLITFLTIFISFKISWRYIKKNKGQLKVKLKKNAALLRYLVFDCFDLTSFASFLLELYRKNIIDIQSADGRVIIIKRTDNLKMLERCERRAVQQLFVKDDTILNMGKANFLKIKRASVFLKKDMLHNLKIYMFKMNGGYLFFSLGMLLIGEFAISALQLDVWRTFLFLSGTTVVIFLGIILFSKKTNALWKSVLLKILACVIIIPALAIMHAFVSLPSSLLITASLVVIRRFVSFYSQKNGVLKEPLEETEHLRQSFIEADNLNISGREIILQQPRLLALGLGEKYADANQKNEYNKLQAMLDFLALHKNAKL